MLCSHPAHEFRDYLPRCLIHTQINAASCSAGRLAPSTTSPSALSQGRQPHYELFLQRLWRLETHPPSSWMKQVLGPDRDKGLIHPKLLRNGGLVSFRPLLLLWLVVAEVHFPGDSATPWDPLRMTAKPELLASCWRWWDDFTGRY